MSCAVLPQVVAGTVCSVHHRTLIKATVTVCGSVTAGIGSRLVDPHIYSQCSVQLLTPFGSFLLSIHAAVTLYR